jgi:hypothetical protein
MAWLIAEGDTPSRLPAFVKLRSSATAKNAARIFSSFRSIYEFRSQALVFFPYYSKTLFGHTLELGNRKNGWQRKFSEEMLCKSANLEKATWKYRPSGSAA